jgi:lysophospholipase L1-like esterase
LEPGYRLVKLIYFMRLKIAFIVLLSCFSIVIIASIFLLRKYYQSYNLLRFDPLEENKINNVILYLPKNNSAIWLFGDSRISQWNKDLFSSFKVNVENLGIEGQTSSQVLNRLKNNLVTGIPKWIFLEVGINDLKIIGLNKKSAISIKDGCFRNIAAIIKLCKENNINLILINIFPTGKIELLRRFVWNSSVDSAIIQVNERLESYCSENNVLYFDAYSVLSDGKSSVKKIFQNGFLHINEEAYAVLSSNIIKQFGNEIK